MPQVVRVILNSGHGLGNRTIGVFDEGASSEFGTEAYIVSRLVEQVYDHFDLKHDSNCGPLLPITVITTPVCGLLCEPRHPNRSHLSFLVEWLNENAIHTKTAGYGDVILSVHMNEGPPNVSGVLVVISATAPIERHYEAAKISKLLAGKLGIPDKGVMLDTETPRHRDAIVRDTHAPAFLIELGFVSNKGDVAAVETCGPDALIAVVESLEAHR